MNKYFHYCSPLIYPIMPEKAGKTIIKLDFATVIMNHVPNSEELEDAVIVMSIDVFFDGELQSTKNLKLRLKIIK